jgi:integrase
VKLKDLIDRFITAMNDIDPLGESHLYCLRRLQRYPIVEKMAAELKKTDVVDHVMARRAEGVCAATAMHDVTFLRGVLKYAPSRWDDCENVSDACITAAMPMLTKHGLIGKSTARKRRPTDDELHRLIDYLTEQDQRSKVKAVPCMMFALASTRRRGEICRMQRGDIDWEKRTYMIRDLKHPTMKKGNHVTFPLFDELAVIIKAQPRLTDSPEERVFPYNDKSLGARYTLAKKALGIVDLRFHDCRREAISRYLKILPPHEVRLISGHRNTIVLEKSYDGRKPEDLHAKYDKLTQVAA